MKNDFDHIELMTGDVTKAKRFYSKLFQWKFEGAKKGPGKAYTMVDTGGAVAGGMTGKALDAAPPMWIPYVNVDSLQATIAKARKLGAEVMIESQEVPGMGIFGVFKDPMGATIAAWEKLRASKKRAPAKVSAAKKAPNRKAAPKRAPSKRTTRTSARA